MLESILQLVPLISVIIVAGLLVFAFINFSISRKNIQRQSQQQIAKFKNIKWAGDLFENNRSET